MPAMQTRTAFIATTATAAQTITENGQPVLASAVVQVIGLAGGATAIAANNYTVQSAAPTAAGQVQFAGTANAPSSTLTFDAALAANGLLAVVYVPHGGVPASI